MKSHNDQSARNGASSHGPRASQGRGRASRLYLLFRTLIKPRTKITEPGMATVWVGFTNEFMLIDGERVTLTEAVAYDSKDNVVFSVAIDPKGQIRLWNTMLDCPTARQATRNWLDNNNIIPAYVALRFWK